MSNKQKRILCIVTVFLMILSNIYPDCVLFAKEDSAVSIEDTYQWLEKKAEDSTLWEDEDTINDACNIMGLLRVLRNEKEIPIVSQWSEDCVWMNTDELAHLSWAYGSQEYLDMLLDWQNEDGGLGLDDFYSSDVYDTMLVLNAMEAVYYGQDVSYEELNKEYFMAQFILSKQNEDGGFSYNKLNKSDEKLSAEIGNALVHSGLFKEDDFEELDKYCLNAFTGDFSEENYDTQIRLARYLYLRKKIENTSSIQESLKGILNEDGSIYEDIDKTIEYILLQRAIEQFNKVDLNVNSIRTESDSYVLNAGVNQSLQLKTSIIYSVNVECNGKLVYTVYEDDETIFTSEKSLVFEGENEELVVENLIPIKAKADSSYYLMTELYYQSDDSEENLVKSQQIPFTVHVPKEKDFILTAEVTEGEDYHIDLDWTQISDEDNQYGYRVYRRKEENPWETCSTWDGEEKVRVLNIYPDEKAKNYLVTWMNSKLDNSNEIAGKGLFEIDTVHIDLYNVEPEKYLLDEYGNYQYDVLVFGIMDSNCYKDLTEKSYEATQQFIDSGRGVLFGHDTVIKTFSNFDRFSEQLGIVTRKTEGWVGASKVDVIKQGLLTNYPWKLRGTLDIPKTHANCQFTGGTTTATVWMRLQVNHFTDPGCGGTDNGYLCSKNSLALIQTGHSSGQISDDERKVLANTLFYLKQRSNVNNMTDQSFYDENSPESPVVDAGELESVELYSMDNGTKYEYYVDAIPMNQEEKNRKTNVVQAKAESGLKGFIVGVSESKDSMKDLVSKDKEGNIQSKIIESVDGKAVVDISQYAPGKKYLHVYAIDNAGNISDETIVEVYISNKLEIKDFYITSDKNILRGSHEENLKLLTKIDYSTCQSCNAKLKYTLLQDGEEQDSWKDSVVFDKNSSQVIDETDKKIMVNPSIKYEIRVDLLVNEEDGNERVIASKVIPFTVYVPKEFNLEAEVTRGKDYHIDLSWTDISDEFNKYGYRLFRRKQNEDWQTRSTWDGEEKVRVLNVYPTEAARYYLKNWMEQTVSELEEPAGKGLFEIDTVNIRYFNQNPNGFLLDENGCYKYDVLMFGTSDCNAGEDLTEKSYQATKEFIDSGRGVLFGHDTIAYYGGCEHTYFARFADQLGIQITKPGKLVVTEKVNIVNHGMLTSYPWKLRGALEVPSTHASGQHAEEYTGEYTAATVWMKLQFDHLFYKESGTAYLFTNNSLAMIQTGHSSGSATDDERKVFANTLFYLKQLTNITQTRDQSFYDETAPNVPEVNAEKLDAIEIESVDNGTSYEYYVEGLLGEKDEEGRQSNIIEATAESGLNGFVIGVSDSQEPMKDLIQYKEDGSLQNEVIPAVDGKAVFDASQYGPEAKYLHIYAVDNAGNISEEQITEVVNSHDKDYMHLPFAIFSSQDRVDINCYQSNIFGNIYANECLHCQGSQVDINGAVMTTGKININAYISSVTEAKEEIEGISLPDYSERIVKDMEDECTEVNRITTYNSTSIESPTICNETTGAWCPNILINANFVSKGSISFNAQAVECGKEEPVVMTSQDGDISIRANSLSGNGLIYAPNGTVSIYTSDFNFKGTIVAKKVYIEAGHYNHVQG